jgi:hypothetical protein
MDVNLLVEETRVPVSEKFKDTTVVIRTRNSKKIRQYNGQKKKDKP